MTPSDLMGLRAELDAFVGEFRSCFVTDETAGHLGVYVRGQLGGLPRKSVEPIALEAGVPPRTLQEFLSLHRWDEAAMRRRIRTIVARDHADQDAIGVIDETSVAKKGKGTAGIQRQYCGSTGKIDNCVVTVHLGYVARDFHALIDSDLYMPASWLEDRARCAKVDVPEDLVFRAKWQIALDLIDRSRADGMLLRWIVADEGYGHQPAFLDGLVARRLLYVVEIPRSVEGWTPAGRRGGEREKRRVESLWQRGGPSWETFRVKETEKGPVVWHARATRFHPSWDAAQEVALVIAENALTGETKYFLSNAPRKLPLASVLTVAFSRWHIERLFEDAKQEVGFSHFEVRKYRALQRHFAVSMLSLLFLNRAKRAWQAEKGAAKAIANAVATPDRDRGAARPDALAARA